ncbi:cytosine permease [Streptomyces sp. E11-3]|uniref:cytosine permease n=1 Tax=Streptomyces sp. E11-3 TaxID=3110112 RepID=UPI003980EF83
MQIEQYGVETIPDEERTSRPRDVVSFLLGSNLALGVVIFGWLPVSFGLGFWPSVSSLLVGTLVGTFLIAPLALVSLRTATNLSTSSGAQFGVRGRLIGSVIGLLLSLGYSALTLWVGGDAMVATMGRLFGMPETGVGYALIYAVLAGATAFAAIYGYRLLLRLSRALAIGMTLLLIVGVFAYAPDFTTAAPAGSEYLLGGFWPTWVLSTVAAGLSGPIAFILLLGDYTRYISPKRYSSKKVWLATCVGLVVGLSVPQFFGTFTALAAGAYEDYAGPLVAASPVWFLVPLLIAASAGSIGNAGLMLYSMGLDLDAIMPRTTRTRATYAVAVVSTVMVFVGHFAWNAQDAMTSFVLALTAVGTPWAVIVLIGYVRCRGEYDNEALQVLNRRAHGGAYWFRGGWNPQATAAWAAGSAVGLFAVDTPNYTGPLVDLLGGLDFSFLLSGAVGGVLYVLLAPRASVAARIPDGVEAGAGAGARVDSAA